MLGNENKVNPINLTFKERVIDGGYCIGCGACTQVKRDFITIDKNSFGYNQAIYKKKDSSNTTLSSILDEICPFSGKSKDEQEIGEEIFGNIGDYNPQIGYSLSGYAGYAKTGNLRDIGASGGLSTWLLTYLLENKLVDGVIHVRASNIDGKLFKYQISTSRDEIIEGAKSKYYPVEMSEVLESLKQLDGRYAFVGVPCFVKAIRLLSREDKELNKKIRYCVGLVCGHLKSDFFAKMFGWHCGIKPSDLQNIDFRTKLKSQSANNYGVTVSDGENIRISKPISKLYGTNWGYGFFKYKACDYCDDVLAETADIVLGDAWLPKYHHDDRGTNVVVVRNKEIDEILKKEAKKGNIYLDILSKEEIIQSQKGGFTHRREGLAIRLYKDLENNIWVPKKRVRPQFCNNKKLLKKYLTRSIIRDKSILFFKEAIEKDDFEYFISQMRPYTDDYDRLYKASFINRVLKRLNREIHKIIK